MSYQLGEQLGNYRLVRLLGEGGFAQVYLAEHLFLEKPAAIKVLHDQVPEEARETFLKEARTIASLEHPHIVRVLDFGIEHKTPFLVMHYAPNGTLRQRHCERSRVPLSTIVSYIQQIASALQYAHTHNVVHRDIKPQNMLIGLNDEILLSDFGIAVVLESNSFQSTLNQAGTSVYMAPEQFRGRPRPASDQYALGVVVYEWLCGEPPFQGTSLEIAMQHQFAAPPPLREMNPDLSPELEHVVLKALAKDPEERFASVVAFTRAFQEAVQNREEPSMTVPISTLPVPSVEEASILPVHADASVVPEPGVSATHERSWVPSAPLAHPTTPSTELLAVSARSVSQPVQAVNISRLPTTRLNARVPEASAKHGRSRRVLLIGLVAVIVVVVLSSSMIWFNPLRAALSHLNTPTEVGISPGASTSPPVSTPTVSSTPAPVRTGTRVSSSSPPAPARTPTMGSPHVGSITEFPIPTANNGLWCITAGTDGNLWFTDQNAGIGRITPSGVPAEFLVPTANSSPTGITAGPDGALWFTESNNGSRIGRITTSGRVTEFPIPTATSQPLGITAGPDGALWFTESLGNKIGRITTSGSITEFPIPTVNSGPTGITAGPDGALWFTEGDANKIGRITTSGSITEFPIPPADRGPYSSPWGITAGPDGNLWFTESDAGYSPSTFNKIGRITTSGSITEFAIPTANSGLVSITSGPDGNLWFTESNANKIGRITTNGKITEFAIPTANSGLVSITSGPDGNLWFTENGFNKIGRITSGK